MFREYNIFPIIGGVAIAFWGNNYRITQGDVRLNVGHNKLFLGLLRVLSHSRQRSKEEQDKGKYSHNREVKIMLFLCHDLMKQHYLGKKSTY